MSSHALYGTSPPPRVLPLPLLKEAIAHLEATIPTREGAERDAAIHTVTFLQQEYHLAIRDEFYIITERLYRKMITDNLQKEMAFWKRICQP